MSDLWTPSTLTHTALESDQRVQQESDLKLLYDWEHLGD